VYAASFIRRHRIVLEEDLFEDETLLHLILIHELFHFVWPRLGNSIRDDFSRMILAEVNGHARGELGESSGTFKEAVLHRKEGPGSRAWKYYVCESFCDTAAWFFSGVGQHQQFQLDQRWTKRRAQWFRSNVERYTVS
jgi:hypothetical protein